MKARGSCGGATPSPARARSSLGGGSLRSSLGSNGENTGSLSTNLVPLSDAVKLQDPLFQAQIRKSFGAEVFGGKVINIDVDVVTRERWYHVTYEDGDEEHLTAGEICRCLVERCHPGAGNFGGALSASGSRRASAAPLAFSAVPTPRPSGIGANSGHPQNWPAAGMPWPPAGAPSQGGTWTLAVVALVVAVVGILPSCISCLSSFAFGSFEEDALRGGVAGLAPPLPPWAQEASLAAAGAVADPWPDETAKAMEATEELAARVTPLHSWAEMSDEALSEETFEKASPVMEDDYAEAESLVESPGAPAPEPEPSMESPGQAPAMSPSLPEEEFSVAVAALTEASAFLFRVVARSFCGLLEEAWLSILAAFSWAISGQGATTSEEYFSGYYEQANATDESTMDSLIALLAISGVLIIFASILPVQVWPFSSASAAGPPAASVRDRHAPTPQRHRGRFAPPTSPVHIQDSPAPLRVPLSPQAAPVAPAPITPAVSSRAPGDAASGARTLMALMGRTPAAAGAGLDGRSRRPPPPPASLMAAPQPQMPQLQVGACYVEASPQCQERVVKVIALRGDSAFVQPYAVNRGRSGKLTFNRDKRFHTEVLVKVTDLKDGPFTMAVGGRAPTHINARFGSHEEPEEQFSAATHDPYQVMMTPARPTSMPGQSTVARLKSKFVVDENRFRYTSSLNKLKEMGFEDCPDLRDILTKWGGDVSYTLRDINGSPLHGVRA